MSKEARNPVHCENSAYVERIALMGYCEIKWVSVYKIQPVRLSLLYCPDFADEDIESGERVSNLLRVTQPVRGRTGCHLGVKPADCVLYLCPESKIFDKNSDDL